MSLWNRLDSPAVGRRLFGILCGICAALTLADLAYHKHVHFSWEGWFGFYGFYGFLGCVFLVLAAKQLRRIVMRSEDYYDGHDR